MNIVRDIALLLARIAAGMILIAHGWQRWQLSGLETQERVLSEAGLPSPGLLAVAVLIFEVLGGVLLIFGLATPIVGLGMVAMNVAVIFTTRAAHGLYLNAGGWEYNVALASLGLLFTCLGAGRIGMDHLFVRPKDEIDELIASTEN